MSINPSNDTMGNGTRDLPACSALLQTTALPRIFAPIIERINEYIAVKGRIND
jgi:hypothetical protein